MCLTTKL